MTMGCGGLDEMEEGPSSGSPEVSFLQILNKQMHRNFASGASGMVRLNECVCVGVRKCVCGYTNACVWVYASV